MGPTEKQERESEEEEEEGRASSPPPDKQQKEGEGDAAAAVEGASESSPAGSAQREAAETAAGEPPAGTAGGDEPIETSDGSSAGGGGAAVQHNNMDAPAAAAAAAAVAGKTTPEATTSTAAGSRPGGEEQASEEQQQGNPTGCAEHLKKAAARFRALMDRRERSLEEAMSDPQTRTDLAAMFPGDDDYHTTLLAGVRGMEEGEFQELLSTARKRRRGEGVGSENGVREGIRKVPKVGDAVSPSPPSATAAGGLARARRDHPPPQAGWEGGAVPRERYYPPPHQPPHHQAAYADTYYHSGADHPREMVERRGGAPFADAAAAAAGGTQEWSRQQRHPHQQELHPARGRAGSASDGQVAAPSRPPMTGAGATPAPASVAEQVGGAGEGRGSGRSRAAAAAAAAGDYYDHLYYQRDREPRGEGGPVMGGRGRYPYNNVGPSVGAQGSPAAVPAAHHPYPGPPRVAHDHYRVGGGAGGRGGGGRPRSPVHMAARGSSRSSGHPMRPSDRGGEAVLPPRYVRASPPSINQTLCEAIERIFEHREKLAGAGVGVGGRVASAAVTEGSNTSTGLRGDAKMNGGRRGAAPPPPGATLRIIAIMESFEGRLNDVMSDARARAELDAIFPGMHEREFRALLEECIERSQTPPLYRQPADRDYRNGVGGGERVFGRMEAERMYQERERAYRRDHPGHPHEPPPPPMYQEMRDREERFYASPRRPYPHPDVAYHDAGYLRRRPGAVGVYHEQRPPVAAARGGGGGYVHANRALGPEDSSHMYYDPELEAPSYPQYAAAAAGRGRGVPPEEAAAAAAAASAGMAGPPPLYKPPVRRGPEVGLSQPSEGGACHHNGHHPRGGGSGGGGSHHSSAPTDGSPRDHGRRRVGASPSRAQSLRGDTRPRGGSVASLPPSASGPTVVTNGAGGDGRLEDDGTSSTTSRPDDPKWRSSEERGDGGGGGGGGRHPAASGGARPRMDSLAGEDCDVGKPFCEVVRDATGLTRLFIPETPPVVPRRPPSKGNKRETLGDIALRIPVTVMRPYFNYPLRTAAEAMNISVTTLKRLCRRHGVKRWPHRQISGINRAMAHLEFQQDQAGRRNSEITIRNNQVSEQMQELLRRRQVMIEHAFESDDGGSRQQWKSSDSEDEGGGGGGGGDPESFSDTNPDHHHAFAPKRRATKEAAAIGNGNTWARGGDDNHNTDAVAPAYNRPTADLDTRGAVHGDRGRPRPRSPDDSPTGRPEDEEYALSPRGRAPANPPMQSRRRLLPPTRPSRPTPPGPPLPSRGGEEATLEVNQREQLPLAQMAAQHQQQQQQQACSSGEEEEEEEEGGSRRSRRVRKEGTDNGGGDEIGEEEEEEEEGGDVGAERRSSRRRSDSSYRSPSKQQQAPKRKQGYQSGDRPPPAAESAASPSSSSSSSSSRDSKRARHQAPAAAAATAEQQQQQQRKSPVSKPTSPLTCGPRLSPGQSTPGGGGGKGKASSKPPSSSLPELPVFNHGDGPQEGWGAPTAPTPSTAQEA
ncbi:unnamed protein product [Ectocarpus sp. CCAP 1310/34]|nr:unnamed protein product [Ectocarpus sp. CCAP 1310/34]